MHGAMVPPGHRNGDAHGDLQIELSPVDRLIARTPLVGVGEYVCPVQHPQFRGGGPETCPYIVFSRATVKLLPNRGRAEVCSPVNVNLLDVGDSYERQPVSREGVRCDWIALSPALLRDVVREFAPRAADTSGSVFGRAVAPISARTFLAQRQFFDAVRGGGADPLALEERTLALVAGVVREALRADAPPEPKARRNGSRPYDLVEAAKRLLAQEYASDHSIVDIARRLHASPAYLSRTFMRHTGCSLHGYRQQLRLRGALDLLGDHRFNGAAVATQLGFSSHSHFTDVFRRAFGLTPGEFARRASTASLANLRDALRID